TPRQAGAAAARRPRTRCRPGRSGSESGRSSCWGGWLAPEPAAHAEKYAVRKRMSADAPQQGLNASLIGAVLSGRYRLDSKLGSGGMSTVYLATDQTLQRQVAIKVLHNEMTEQPEQHERFRR